MEQAPNTGRVAFPCPLTGSVRCGASHARAQARLAAERAESLSKRFRVKGILENKAIHAIPQKSSYASAGRGDNGQPAGHGLSNRHAKRIFPAGADIDVGSSIGIENVGARGFPDTSVGDAELAGQFTPWRGVVAADNEEPYPHIGQFGQGLQYRREAFVGPIIPNQQQDQFVIEKLPQSAGLSAAGKPKDGRELKRVDGVGDDRNVLPTEVFFEELGGSRRNCGERNFWV